MVESKYMPLDGANSVSQAMRHIPSRRRLRWCKTFPNSWRMASFIPSSCPSKVNTLR